MAAAKKPSAKDSKRLAVTVVLSGPDTEVHTFGPDTEEIPDWALEKMGDHVWNAPEDSEG